MSMAETSPGWNRQNPPLSNIQLRNVVEADLPFFFEQQRDPVANRMADFPAREWDAFLPHWMKILSDEEITRQTILDDGQVAGNIVSFNLFGEREVGYWIGQEYWGKGVATRALSLFLGLEKQRPLHAHVARHNFASQRVLEKCGFIITGEGQYTNFQGEEVQEFLLTLR
jgi:RimJ/RimL family protein N-acetyltransferase